MLCYSLQGWIQGLVGEPPTEAVLVISAADPGFGWEAAHSGSAIHCRADPGFPKRVQGVGQILPETER